MVSVLLPVFNAGRYLHQAIESVLEQDYGDLDVVIIDDASTDRSPEVIRQYAERDSRIRAVFHEDNYGLADTLNEGLTLTRHLYVARMDQDDVSLPHRVRTQLEFAQKNPDLAVVGSFVYHMGATRERDRLVRLPRTDPEIREALTTYNCMYHPTVLLKRDAMLGVGGYRREFKNAEDYDLWLRVSTDHRLANIPEPLIRYRFSVNGMTLGKKWQQLYYVYLAQAAHRSADGSIEAARPLAEQMLRDTDRGGFMRIVATGTVEELVRLQLWANAAALVWKFRRDIGARATVGLLRLIVRARLGANGAIAPV